MKANKKISQGILFVLSITFTVGLVFSSLELPSTFDSWLQKSTNFPGFDQQASSLNISKTQMYFSHYNLKLYGYIGLGIVLLLIIVGFATNRSKVSLIGAFAMFLPIFGHFALTMFFLAGLGFLRVLWIPLNDISPILMRLGDLIYIPYNLLVGLGDLMDINLRKAVPVFFISLGVVLFVFGVFIWFSTKFSKSNVAKSWIYKVSRHPQYLGWILWSYGLFLMPVEQLKKSWGYADTLPWLLSSMIIVAISFIEELNMKRKYGNDYEVFRKSTSFLFPLPKLMKRFLVHPLKVFFKKARIERKREAILFVSYYTIIIMLISYIYIAFTDPTVNNTFLTSKRKEKVKELISQLETSTNRRSKDIAAMELARYGDLAFEPLIGIIDCQDAETQNFVLWCLNKIGKAETKKHIAKLLESNIELSAELIKSIEIFKVTEAESALIDLIQENKPFKSESALALASLNSEKAIDVLIDQFALQDVYTQMAFIEALGKLRSEKAADLIISQLQIENIKIKEAAIIALASIKPTKAIAPLEKIANGDNWELSIYAKESIKAIKGS